MSNRYHFLVKDCTSSDNGVTDGNGHIEHGTFPKGGPPWTPLSGHLYYDSTLINWGQWDSQQIKEAIMTTKQEYTPNEILHSKSSGLSYRFVARSTVDPDILIVEYVRGFGAVLKVEEDIMVRRGLRKGDKVDRYQLTPDGPFFGVSQSYLVRGVFGNFIAMSAKEVGMPTLVRSVELEGGALYTAADFVAGE